MRGDGSHPMDRVVRDEGMGELLVPVSGFEVAEARARAGHPRVLALDSRNAPSGAAFVEVRLPGGITVGLSAEEAADLCAGLWAAGLTRSDMRGALERGAARRLR